MTESEKLLLAAYRAMDERRKSENLAMMQGDAARYPKRVELSLAFSKGDDIRPWGFSGGS